MIISKQEGAIADLNERMDSEARGENKAPDLPLTLLDGADRLQGRSPLLDPGHR